MPKFEGSTIGAPCWIDLTSDDLNAVKPFYRALFGWEFADMGEEFGNYNVISISEDVVGGAMQFSAEYMRPIERNAWTIYFATEDAQASLNKAQEHGGEATSPVHEVSTQGHMATAVDTSGSRYGLWQPGDRMGFDRIGEPGFPGWFELNTRDREASMLYYESVLPATSETVEVDGHPYAMLKVDGEPRCGITDSIATMPAGTPFTWMVNFIVKDVDETVAMAGANGGTLIGEPHTSQDGRFALLKDPKGAMFFVL